MDSDALDRDQTSLEKEIDGKDYGRLLRELRVESPFLRQFDTWRDVLKFMRAGDSKDPRKDEVLRPIFQAHGEDQDPKWRTLLTAIFWPGLAAIYWKRLGWDRDGGDLWQNITWTFLQVICRIDVARRPCRIAQKIINDTIHNLYEDYSRKWSLTKKEVSVEPETLAALASGRDDIDYAGIELRLSREAELRRLRAHLEAGRIGETDYLLLVGTRVYGKPLVDVAREEGIEYEFAKKRRQRAEFAIQKRDRMEDMMNNLSPREPQ